MTQEIDLNEVLFDGPIGRSYVEWANTLDSAGQDSMPARSRLNAYTVMRFLYLAHEFTRSAEGLDELKKWIFYNKEVSGLSDDKLPLNIEEIRVLQAQLDDHEQIRLLHAIIGMCTESGEMLQEFCVALMEGRPVSRENMIEEAGDQMWYQALLAKWAGFHTFDEFMLTNKAKLTARYGTTWNREGAVNRDTENEMTQLRSSLDWDDKTVTTVPLALSLLTQARDQLNIGAYRSGTGVRITDSGSWAALNDAIDILERTVRLSNQPGS